MEQRREQLVEEIRIAERARDLLAGLERRLKERERDRSNLEKHLGRLERLAGSLPEAHTVRLLAEDAVRSVRQDSRRGLCRFRREQVPLEDRGDRGGTGEGRGPIRYGRVSGARTAPVVA
jgi:hypothetical protein